MGETRSAGVCPPAPGSGTVLQGKLNTDALYIFAPLIHESEKPSTRTRWDDGSAFRPELNQIFSTEPARWQLYHPILTRAAVICPGPCRMGALSSRPIDAVLRTGPELRAPVLTCLEHHSELLIEAGKEAEAKGAFQVLPSLPPASRNRRGRDRGKPQVLEVTTATTARFSST